MLIALFNGSILWAVYHLLVKIWSLRNRAFIKPYSTKPGRMTQHSVSRSSHISGITSEAVSRQERNPDFELDDILDISFDDHAAEPNLCERCQRFDIQSFANVTSRRRGYLLRDVRIAAANGCEFCSLILDGIKDIEIPTYFLNTMFSLSQPVETDLYVHMTVSENYKIQQNESSPGLRANRLLLEVGDRFDELRTPSASEICLVADATSSAALGGDIIGRYLGQDPASDEHYATVVSWVKQCAYHPQCNQTVSGLFNIDPYRSDLPARCIEIPKEGRRLFLRETQGSQGAYITLTHRWNQETHFCRTTMENYQARLEGNGFGTIPRLFENVLTIARNLDVKYVWIDSICIIQEGDQGADWRREAPKMAQYYQLSLLTIAGTTPDLENGILNAYPDQVVPWESTLVRLPYSDRTLSRAGHFYVYKRKRHLVDEYWEAVRSSILLRRGWVLQEWLLSKRILWFTPEGVFFECHSELPRTIGGEGIHLDRAKPELRTHLQLKQSLHFTNTYILDFWYSALQIYTDCELTKPELDRVVAVAGLAKEVYHILSDPKLKRGLQFGEMRAVYLSGLWLRDIHHGVLWEQSHSSLSWTRRLDDAPSWSWTCLMVPVIWAPRAKDVTKALKILGVCLQKRAAHVTPQQTLAHSQSTRPLDSDTAQDGTGFSQSNVRLPFDPTNMFGCLHISGRLYPVHVRGYLGTKENLEKAAISTAYGTVPQSCQWRAVCSPSRPEIIAGWGSLEQLRDGETECADFGIAIIALHVSTRYVRRGWLITKSDPVLDVLFIQQIKGDKTYRRLGVGRIADAQLIRNFLEVEEETIQLV